MADVVNVGTSADSGNGDTERVAMQKINAEFASIRAVLTDRGAWATGVLYNKLDTFTQSGNVYVVGVTHTSGVFATDLAAGKFGLSDASTLRYDLSLSTAEKGAGIVSFGPAANYMVGSTGYEINQLKAGLSASENALRIDSKIIQKASSDLSAGVAVQFACFGDSTMYGASAADLSQVPVPPTVQLQNLVNNFNGNSALTVINNGLSGTTATQMISGADGTVTTFDAKMAASSAKIVYCNHGVNDAFGGSATTADAYQTALSEFVRICRKYNKAPVIVTPFACLTVGGFGSLARAEATQIFAEIARVVAAQLGVTLIDQNLIQRNRIASGVKPLDVLPDGVHGNNTTYILAGANLSAVVLGAHAPRLNGSGEKVPVSSSFVKATNMAINPDASSSVGLVITTGVTAGQSMRACFFVDGSGADISVGLPIWASGSNVVNLSIDGINSISFSQFQSGFGSTFFHDFEITVSQNLEPGFHIIIASTTGSGATGMNFIRSVKARKVVPQITTGASVVRASLITSELSNYSTVANSIIIIEDFAAPVPAKGNVEFRWTSKMAKNSGFVTGGKIGTLAGSTTLERARTFGLNSSGFLTMWEATAPGVYTVTVLGGADLSLVSRSYRLVVGGGMNFYVDGVLLATPSFSTSLISGNVGLWKGDATGECTLSNLSVAYL